MENKNNSWCTDVSTVRKYGIVSAAIISRIQFWCDYNEKNKIKDRFYDGYWWSGYMRPEDLESQLGVVASTIKKNIYKLIKDGVLIKAKYNKKGFDRTNWYRYNGIDQNGTMDCTKMDQSIVPNESNGLYENGTMESTELDQTIPVNPSVKPSVNSKSVKPSVNPPLNPIEHRSAGEIQFAKKSQLAKIILDKFGNKQLEQHQLFRYIETGQYERITLFTNLEITNEDIQIFEEYIESKL